MYKVYLKCMQLLSTTDNMMHVLVARGLLCYESVQLHNSTDVVNLCQMSSGHLTMSH